MNAFKEKVSQELGANVGAAAKGTNDGFEWGSTCRLTVAEWLDLLACSHSLERIHNPSDPVWPLVDLWLSLGRPDPESSPQILESPLLPILKAKMDRAQSK